MKITNKNIFKQSLSLFVSAWLMSSASLASTVSMTTAQLDDFSKLSDQPVTDTSITNNNGVNISNNGLFDFSTIFLLVGSVGSQAFMTNVGYDYSLTPLNWSAYDSFEHNLISQDQNALWNFSFTLFDGAVERSTSVLGVSSTAQAFQIDLTPDSDNFDRANIEKVFITVSAELPMPDGSSVAEYSVDFQLSQVPLPGSAWLFISGLVGLLMARKR